MGRAPGCANVSSLGSAWRETWQQFLGLTRGRRRRRATILKVNSLCLFASLLWISSWLCTIPQLIGDRVTIKGRGWQTYALSLSLLGGHPGIKIISPTQPGFSPACDCSLSASSGPCMSCTSAHVRAATNSSIGGGSYRFNLGLRWSNPLHNHTRTSCRLPCPRPTSHTSLP